MGEAGVGKHVRVEGYPFDVIKQNQPACYQQLAKVLHVYTFFFESFEIYARGFEEFDRVGCIHVVPDRQFNMTAASTPFRPGLALLSESQLRRRSCLDGALYY